MAQRRLEALSTEFEKIQTDLARSVEARQRLDVQLSENEIVQKELEQLKPGNAVYKLIGPVLVKQDPAEAKSNVTTRLEYIRGEMKRVEIQIKEHESKSHKKREELEMALQQAQQQGGQDPSKTPPTTKA